MRRVYALVFVARVLIVPIRQAHYQAARYGG